MNAKQVFTVLVALAILAVSTVNSLEWASAGSFSDLSMPEEYLNYTICIVNGAPWAIIDGTYPMHLTSGTAEALPMVYPTPPDTTNIHIKLDGKELVWGNYSDIDPAAWHHTDIGDWQMIYCTVEPKSADFLLEIHYEHPIEIINGTYTFLYDLNISPYLSPTSTTSTAYFNIQLPLNYSELKIYTTGTSGDAWSRVNYDSNKTDLGETVTFSIVSEYDKPLKGDIAFVISDAAVPEFPAWIFVPLLAAATLMAALLRMKGSKGKSR